MFFAKETFLIYFLSRTQKIRSTPCTSPNGEIDPFKNSIEGIIHYTVLE